MRHTVLILALLLISTQAHAGCGFLRLFPCHRPHYHHHHRHHGHVRVVVKKKVEKIIVEKPAPAPAPVIIEKRKPLVPLDPVK